MIDRFREPDDLPEREDAADRDERLYESERDAQAVAETRAERAALAALDEMERLCTPDGYSHRLREMMMVHRVGLLSLARRAKDDRRPEWTGGAA